jgi:hypothetical protein
LKYSYSIIFPASDFASSALSPGLFVQPLDYQSSSKGNQPTST